MGWFWDTKPHDANEDPYKKLDPALREFLERESPLKYEDIKPKSSQVRSHIPKPGSVSEVTVDAHRSRHGLDTPGNDQSQQDSIFPSDRPVVPPESLFQDGRYAHIWKTYRPQEEIEQAGRSDQDRLADVVEAYNDRKAAIGRAAVENCVEYQMAEKDCFSNGGWAKRMTMCREENRAFHRCYNMQARFLKALGYLAQPRSQEDEERIQMHADKLYHEMLERERLANEAKEQGLEAPELPPLIQADNVTKALGEDSAWAQARRKAQAMGYNTNLSSFPPERQEEIRKKIEGMSKEDKELELQLIAAESRAQIELAEQVREKLEDEKRNRADRRERGKETVGDTIKRLWGWDNR